jgi:hypothetical protein
VILIGYDMILYIYTVYIYTYTYITYVVRVQEPRNGCQSEMDVSKCPEVGFHLPFFSPVAKLLLFCLTYAHLTYT